MKNILLNIVCCVVLVVSLAGCKNAAGVLPPKEIERTKTVTITETVHDTVFTTEKDSSYYQAYIDCVNNKPVLRAPKATPGKNLKAPNVKLTDNKLEVDCEAKAQELFFQWKDKYIKENTTTKETIPVAVRLPLTSWQNFQIWLGRIFLFLLLAFITAVILRWKKII